MKEQYIRQVKKELHASRKRKNEVARDLNEIFASAAEHGETERQVVERLGTPKEFADSAAESFGVENCARRNRKGILSCVVSLAAALVAFCDVRARRAESNAGRRNRAGGRDDGHSGERRVRR